MKRCLKCNQTYTDESLNYCLNDGTTLIFESEEQTVVIQKEKPRKKKGLLIIFGVIVLLLVPLLALIGGYFVYSYITPNESARTENKSSVNSSPLPSASSTPQATPKSTANSSNQNQEEKPSPTPDDTITEITPITWTTTSAGFKSEPGQTYKFECPPDGTPGAVWGSDIYTADSSICTASVHAGLISLEDGGVVTIEFRPGRLTYGSTTRNGITTNTYGEYPRSIVVR